MCASEASDGQARERKTVSEGSHMEEEPATRPSKAVVSKLGSLFTFHDRFNMHKFLGFSCLAHYMVRFVWLVCYGTMFFDPKSWVTWVTPFMHVLLSCSSFIFPVPKHRFGSKPIIWKELQIHNIIFTSRSAAMFLLWLVFPVTSTSEHIVEHFVCRFVIMASMHYLADLVSEWYTDKGRTTTRDMPWDQGTPDWVMKSTKKYYAVCQLLATTALLGQTGDAEGRGILEGAFAIMLPIQLSTFLMTLVRKSIISGTQWHIWYAASLGMVYFIPVMAVVRTLSGADAAMPEASEAETGPVDLQKLAVKLVKFSLAPVCVYLRLNLRMDKFVIMAILTAGAIVTMREKFLLTEDAPGVDVASNPNRTNLGATLFEYARALSGGISEGMAMKS
eukprot:CAMPEP_0206243866 /NCGR_PEP_ID=MMETSP0047_2-20121206/17837_1 /ASSEMBLY_ACC=CAM_ASM_000192 /TAXON_ID=195065 /ORGANISM="Chroomonas mesostigmatica_cf, Strain CCMP1168" /LENGTH=389 /DNA_ID=CAMNT_0053669017 /DNA_START=15 /DNA_END=1184 /DNA_ORIENTATION=+